VFDATEYDAGFPGDEAIGARRHHDLLPGTVRMRTESPFVNSLWPETGVF
jgi:hypothetical protein